MILLRSNRFNETLNNTIFYQGDGISVRYLDIVLRLYTYLSPSVKLLVRFNLRTKETEEKDIKKIELSKRRVKVEVDGSRTHEWCREERLTFHLDP